MSQPESGVEHPLPHERVQSAGRVQRKVVARALTVGAIIVVLSFLLFEAHSLWAEWNLLQGDVGTARQSAVVGYRNITPVATYAECPADWFRASGDQSLLWSRWEDGTGHRWYRFKQGDIDQARLRRPQSLFVPRAIDFSMVQTDTGEIWQRVPMDAPVIGLTLLGVKCAYPVMILSKVQVVNELVQEHPFLIVMNVFAPSNEAVSIFDAEREGHRLTMAPTGYLLDNKPLLYDRGTESLWCEQAESLKAVAGALKGKELPRVAHPSPVTWKSWLAQNQNSRLLVGADRSRGIPPE
jgi:hypothetical protein